MKTLRLAAVLALPLLFAAPPALAEDPVPSAKDYPAPPAGWQVPRTAWGDPDLRGMWPVDYLVGTPRERPAELGTRTEWTEEEYRARLATAEEGLTLIAKQDKVGILGMGHWTERGRPLWQTSLITQPANGRMPALTEEGRAAAGGGQDLVEHRGVRFARRLRHLGPLPDARPARLAAAGRLQHGHPRRCRARGWW